MADTSATLLLRTEPIGKLLLRYSLPAIAAMVVFSLYNIIDSIFIGHGVGPLAISGLAITFPVMNLTFALVLLVGIGGASICSIRLGQQDIDGATRVLGNVLLLGLINGVTFGLLSQLVLDPVLTAFGASEHTLPYARDFMQIILYGPAGHLYHVRAQPHHAGHGVSAKSHAFRRVDRGHEHHSGTDIHLLAEMGASGARLSPRYCHNA